VLGGRYQLEEILGRGGMSEVWRAVDLVLSRSVAVKLLSGAFVGDDRFREAIRTEAQTAARVSHPHLASVYDYGESVGESGEPVPYVVTGSSPDWRTAWYGVAASLVAAGMLGLLVAAAIALLRSSASDYYRGWSEGGIVPLYSHLLDTQARRSDVDGPTPT